MDCTKISPQTCVAPQAGAAPHTPQIYYGLWNIYAVNEYFTTIDAAINSLRNLNQDAIGTAAFTASNGVPYNHNDGETYPISTVLYALLAKENNGNASPGAMNTPLMSLLAQKNPGNLFYSFQRSVDQLVDYTLDSLKDALQLIMTDFPTFVSLVQNGAFSTTQLPTLADLKKAYGQ